VRPAPSDVRARASRPGHAAPRQTRAFGRSVSGWRPPCAPRCALAGRDSGGSRVGSCRGFGSSKEEEEEEEEYLLGCAACLDFDRVEAARRRHPALAREHKRAVCAPRRAAVESVPPITCRSVVARSAMSQRSTQTTPHWRT
jgi:hypothetical protein